MASPCTCCRCTFRGPRTGDGGDVAPQWRTNVLGSDPDVGSRAPPAVRRGRVARAAGDMCGSVLISSDLGRAIVARPDRPARRRLPAACITSASQRRFIDAFGERVVPKWPDDDRSHERRVVEERGDLLPRRRDLPRLERRLRHRPDRARRAHRLPGRHRCEGCLWLMPFYPSLVTTATTSPRLLPGVDERLGSWASSRPDPHGQGPGAAGHRRPRREPHVGPASVVPEGSRVRRVRRSVTTTCGRRAALRSAPTSYSPARAGDSIWSWDDQGRAVVPASLLLPPTRPEHLEPRGEGQITRRSPDSGSSSASTGSGSTPCRSCSKAARSLATSVSTRHDFLEDFRSFVGRRKGDAACSAR